MKMSYKKGFCERCDKQQPLNLTCDISVVKYSTPYLGTSCGKKSMQAEPKSTERKICVWSTLPPTQKKKSNL